MGLLDIIFAVTVLISIGSRLVKKEPQDYSVVIANTLFWIFLRVAEIAETLRKMAEKNEKKEV